MCDANPCKGSPVWSAAIIVLLAACTISQASWPQFRGPGSLGVAIDDKPYPTELDRSRNLLWQTKVPEGHSSPCIWGDRIFLTAYSNNKLETLCLDRQDGTIKWRRSVEPEAMEQMNRSNSPASPTPACDGKRLYVYFGTYGLLAYDLDGEVLWKKVLPVPDVQHGSASSPILAGELVVINCDQRKDPYLLALDQSTGDQVWRAKRPPAQIAFNWATPVLWMQGGTESLVVLGRNRLTAYDPGTGRELWWVEGLPMETASTPVFTEQAIYAAATTAATGDPVNPIEVPDFQEVLEQYDSNGDKQLAQAEIPDDFALIYRMGPIGPSGLKKNFPRHDTDRDGVLSEGEWKQVAAEIGRQQARAKDVFLAVSGGGTGNVTASHVQWTVHEGVGQVASPLVYDGRAYLVKHGGNITCFNATTGERIYSEKLGQRVYYFASPVAAHGKIYVCSDMGRVFVLQAGDAFKVLAQNSIGERIKATPALAHGNVYLRTEEHMMAFGNP
jgi:outer membrane protein assembly factor BamB